MTEIKPLKKHFSGKGEVKGYEFTQIYGTECAFLYEVSRDGSKYYEVFKKRVNSRYGNVSYPSSNSFGVWAWCYLNFDGAEKKFNEINKPSKTIVNN